MPNLDRVQVQNLTMKTSLVRNHQDDSPIRSSVRAPAFSRRCCCEVWGYLICFGKELSAIDSRPNIITCSSTVSAAARGLQHASALRLLVDVQPGTQPSFLKLLSYSAGKNCRGLQLSAAKSHGLDSGVLAALAAMLEHRILCGKSLDELQNMVAGPVPRSQDGLDLMVS